MFLAVPPIQILDLTGPFEVFARCGGYKVELACFDSSETVSATCGLAVGRATNHRRLRGTIDTLLIVGGEGVERGAADQRLLRWVRNKSKTVRRLASVCTGAFVLAAAGVLDGRRAVTHWQWCAGLAQYFPKVEVDPDALFIKDGNVYTSAGVTAGIDLALALVEEDHGQQRALEIARELVMFLRRPGGQSQFSTALAAQASSVRPLEELQTWILEHLRKDLSVEVLAARCAMSPRHFARLFAKEKRVTPAKFVEQARVEAARRLLEETRRGVKEVAERAGFGSADVMRRSFMRVLGITASEYVRRFK